MKPPRTADDLPFAGDLEPFPDTDDLDGVLEPEGDYDRVLFASSHFTDPGADRARFMQCVFTGGSSFDGGRVRRARLSEVWLGETRLVALDMAETSLTDAWFSGCVLAGVQAYSCIGRRVLLRGCKIDSVNFRDSQLTDVTFEDCVLRDVDFGSARLLRVRFPGSQFSSVDFTKATCRDVDLRGVRLGSDETPGIKAGFDSLSGTTIDLPQLMTLAPHLAHHLGITVAG